ncbi:RICIN domain-containing protein [Kitasatospora sp. NPDC001574]
MRIVNERSGKDLAVENSSQAVGATIVRRAFSPGGPTDDERRLEDAGNGGVRVVNRHSGLYLTAGAAEDSQFEQRIYSGSALQVFAVG